MDSPTSAQREAHTLLTVTEAARQLSIGRTTLFGLIKTGEITSVRIGRARRVPAEALTAYIQQLITGQDQAA